MIPVKKHILNIQRIGNPELRGSYLRLDKNENIIGFDKDMLEIFKNQITSDFLTAYPELSVLRRKIANFLAVNEKNVYITAGSDAGIKSAFETFVERGDSVALLHPTYAMYYIYTDMFQGNLVRINYKKDLSLTAKDVIEVISKHKPKLLCMANPNAPTGTVIPPEGIKEILDVCSPNETIVLIDEAYYPFYPVSSVDFIRQYPNLIVTRTFSKAMGLASTRLGLVVGQEEIIDYLHKVRPIYEANAFAAKFAEIVLDNYQIVEKNLREVNAAKDYLYGQLDGLNIPYHRSYANFVLINAGSRERSVKIGKELYEKRILIKSGFKDGLLDDYIRVSIGSREQMKIFIEALKEIIKYA